MSELSQKNNLCLLAPIYMGFLISILYPYKVKSERLALLYNFMIETIC